MADKPAEPKRWVILTFWQHAVERTEEEIAELKAHLLFVRDASGPDDVHLPPEPAPAAAPAAGTAIPPAGSPPPGGKPDIKEQP